MHQYYMSTWNKVVQHLGSDIYKGLLEYECTRRREQYGNNEIKLPNKTKGKNLIKEIFKQKYIYGMIIAAILFMLNKLYVLGALTIVMLFFNVGVKIYYNIKREKEVEIIQNINSAKVMVLREGVERVIEAVELVKGDIVILKKNSFVSADLRVIKSDGLKVDEKSITGDDYYKDKYEEKLDMQVSTLNQIPNMIFRGSIIKEGTGMGIVVQTGNETELGKVISKIENSLNIKNDLGGKVSKSVIKVITCMILVQVIVYLIFPGRNSEKNIVFMYGIFSAIAICIPVITIFYLKGIRKKLKDDGIHIVNISAIDTVENIKVVFLDKVGTLTKRKLYLDKIYTNETIYQNNKFDVRDINLKRVIDISLLCNNSIYTGEEETDNDIYEDAYLNYGAENRVFKSMLDKQNTRLFQVPVDTNKRIFTTLNKSERGYRANTRGRLEDVLECCTHILVNGIEKEITEDDITKIKLADLGFSRSGLVSEAFAYRSFRYRPTIGENIQSNLVFVGLVALLNPFIDGISEDIDNILESGILPIIFTDENKILGEFLGRKLGLISSSSEVVSGVEMSFMKQEEIYKAISKARVFCRLTPEQKSFIALVFKKDGFKVAVEGETLGDLTRIATADIGVTKGKATNLVKSSSDAYSEISIIKMLLKLKEYREELWNSIRNGLIVYVYLIMAQMMVMNIHYLFTENHTLSEYVILLMNYFILTPIILLNMKYGRNEFNNKKLIIRGALISLAPLLSIIYIDNNYEFAYFAIIGSLILIYTIFNCKIKYRKLHKGLSLLLISIIVMVSLGAVVGFVSGFGDIEKLSIIIGIILIIYSISEIILRKWQE